MPEIARAEALVHRFRDGGLGLDGASLSIEEGELLVLAGRNGSGKSLLARHFIGLARPESGGVFIRGRELRNPADARGALGLVFQDAEAQILGQTLLEDTAFGPANLGLPAPEVIARARAALRIVGLEDRAERSVEGLSGGEKRRLAIAGVLALGPDCLILDEPFANLDYPAIRGVLEVILALREAGTSVLVVTHELEKILAHASRLAIMDAGRLVYDGPPADCPRSDFPRLGLRDPFRGGITLEELTWLDR